MTAPGKVLQTASETSAALQNGDFDQPRGYANVAILLHSY